MQVTQLQFSNQWVELPYVKPEGECTLSMGNRGGLCEGGATQDELERESGMGQEMRKWWLPP